MKDIEGMHWTEMQQIYLPEVKDDHGNHRYYMQYQYDYICHSLFAHNRGRISVCILPRLQPE